MIVLLFLWVNALSYAVVSCQDSVTKRKENSPCNINNYNSFYAGPNKKLENIILGMKRQLDEIREELKNLTKKDADSSKDLPHKNCAELYKSGKTISGVYTIDPDGSSTGAFDVYCDQKTAGGGWTVFQKRVDGSVDFYRTWDDYKNGFGNLNGEFWLGLDKIHRLTTSDRYKLRVDLEDTKGNTAYAEYSIFAITSERTKYQLSLGSYSGTAGDSLALQRGYPFSTRDQDNDGWSSNCATEYKGAWWYKHCHSSNLNGLYHHGKHSSHADGVN
ncbi:ryncolin-2-like [Stylophora pistillata]|uniref:ryncolin-2-like n=1 Tax=Stylophora pistillata TaxID=50429 RepID=UPI000C04C61F|nr:ryncolin-2-like [Stylophora pistillata]